MERRLDACTGERPSVSAVKSLERLAQTLGIATSYWDVDGRHCVPSPETIGAIAQSLSASAERETPARPSRHPQRTDRLLPPVVVVRDNQLPMSLDYPVSPRALVGTLRWRVIEESGAVSEGEIVAEDLGRLNLPRLPIGYHRLDL